MRALSLAKLSPTSRLFATDIAFAVSLASRTCDNLASLLCHPRAARRRLVRAEIDRRKALDA